MRKGYVGVAAIFAISFQASAFAAEPADAASDPAEPAQTVITLPNQAPEFRMPVFKARKSCLRETGSRLRSRDPDGCRENIAGKEISGKALNRANWRSLR